MQQVGIDFGTTNSVVALRGADGGVRSAVFGTDDVFRTVLCFWAEDGRAGQALRHAAGPAAWRPISTIRSTAGSSCR